MLIILLQWFLISFVAVTIGELFYSSLTKLYAKASPIAIPDSDSQLPLLFKALLGLTLIATLANLYSIWFRIDICFTASLLILAIMGARNLSRRRHAWKLTIIGLWPVVVLIALGLATKVTTNVDEAGYYLPLVKWIEHYAVVPGTALINHRLGFNSAIHMLNAVFGLNDILPGGLYKLNALLFVWFNLYFLDAFKKLLVALKSASSFETVGLETILLSTALIFQFAFLCDSMDSDYLSLMTGIIIHAYVISKLYRSSDSKDRDLKLCSKSDLTTIFLICTFLVTVKPFSIFLIGGPLYLLLRGYGWKGFVWGIMGGCSVVLLPWLIRNYYLSGYLLFPVYYLDLFNPDWKVPLHVSQPTYEVIGEFAKLQIIRPDYLYNGVTTPTLNEWFSIWLKITWRDLIGKVVLTGGPLSIIAFLLGFWKSKATASKQIYTYLFYTGLICALWFLTFPSIRFGWSWLLCFMVGAIWLCGEVFFAKRLLHFRRLMAFVISVLVILSWIRIGINQINLANFKQHLVKPKSTITKIPISNKPLSTFSIKQAKDPYCHGVEPPCMPFNNYLNIEQRGSMVEEGFRLKN